MPTPKAAQVPSEMCMDVHVHIRPQICACFSRTVRAQSIQKLLGRPASYCFFCSHYMSIFGRCRSTQHRWMTLHTHHAIMSRHMSRHMSRCTCLYTFLAQIEMQLYTQVIPTSMDANSARKVDLGRHLRTHLRTHVRIHVCTHVRTHVCTQVRTQVRTHVRTHVYTQDDRACEGL